MTKRPSGFRTVEEYIASFSGERRRKLTELRATIRAAAPGAVEKISYRMPAFALEGILVYFAAFKDHLGFFPTGSGVKAFERESTKYKTGKGTLRFPLDEPLPLKLIARIVKFRVAENLKKSD